MKPPPSFQRGSPPGKTPLVSCYGYSGGYRWHWKQTHDSFPGQPVVLIHGVVATGHTLLPLAEAINGWAPVYVPDLPGFGGTPGDCEEVDIPALAASLAEWMGVANAAPAHVIGHSFGSQVAAELAFRFPKRVRSLTLIGPTIDPSARSFRSQAARLFEDIPHEPLRMWSGQRRHLSIRQALRSLRSLLLDEIESKLPSIQTPSLILRGLSDPISPLIWTQHAAQLLPDACCISLNEGAHCVPFSHPALVASAIRKFTFPLRNEIIL